MKARPQITSAEPRIRMPAWRSASPKKWNTLPVEHGAHHARAELRQLAERRDPAAGRARHLITEISGWVASSVWVKT